MIDPYDPETFTPDVLVLPGHALPGEQLLYPGGFIPPAARVAIEHLLMLRISEDFDTSIFRREFLDTAAQPYQRPPVPRNHAVEQARRAHRNRDTTYTTAYAQMKQRFTERGWVITEPPTMMRWRVMLAAENEEHNRVTVLLQPPMTLGTVLDRLWHAGLRIDGFSLGETFLQTVIRAPEQMVQVREMVQWITGYCAVAPSIGLPPAPWRLAASHSLVERIVSYDNVAPPPAAN